jgi:CubicO group peptidase (beta-lactamase class C family)
LADVHGTCDERFAAVRYALSENLDAGLDIGASVAVFLDGEPVVDIWGGHRDAARTLPWERDTIACVFSTTKTMLALCALTLADRGELDLDAPVARYWPEFAAAGKAHVEVRGLLQHTAGLPGWDAPLAPEDLADWEKCTATLAAQAPMWEPGTATGYHAHTQGYLVGEVIRRITGLSVGGYFAAAVAGPLGADFHIGLAAQDDRRVAPLIPPPAAELADLGLTELGARALANPRVTGELTAREWWRRAEIPASNGHGNARSVARVQSVIAGGGEPGGTRLLSRDGVEQIFRRPARGRDLVLGTPMTWGIGFALDSTARPLAPRACTWGGYGGSVILNDLDARLTIAYVMNRMEPTLLGDKRGASIVFATLAVLARAARRARRG